MNDILINAFKSIDMQYFFINKKDNATLNDKYVVFTYIRTPTAYADNKKHGDEYTILVNLYCKNKIQSNCDLIIDTLNEAGLKGGSCQATVLEDTGYYNTAITFKYFLRSLR